ncbi:serine hydrolase domain-containing protein [Tenacibaculum sp. IB213877]|uniref:serine hydrolase domain-containing protein n=1 Tax=Tenacibaculum sp. IB213877 TaxID=3097351 RepID=UPI002A5AE4A0|nr:serine hydrolase domain-containing protein [Tenacibaculum sp. IB213877]MDY0780476.1 serine hydrolase domain-containing protein [Tenacibaculum sp. IB213877]
MKNIKLLLILFISVIFNSCSSEKIKKPESDLNIGNDDHLELINKYVANFPNKTNIAIAIINENGTNYYGILRENDTLKSIINKDKVYEIGSISKVFTSTLLSYNIYKKTINLDDKLGSFFNFELNEGENITLQQLANHTSGLARIPSNMPIKSMISKNPYKQYTSENIEEFLKEKVKLKYKTGEKNKYSNLGAGLLGYILTKKNNKSYEELLQEIICKPLQMTNTTTLREKIKEENLVKGLNKKGKETSNWDFTDALVGAGGIKSSVVDLEKFVRKNFENDSIYNLTHQKTYAVNDKMEIGLGWHIFGGDSVLWHNGGTGGYRSCMAFNKDKKTSVIVLSNVSSFNKKSNNIDKLCFELIKNN